MIKFDRFKDGKHFAVTFSFDDGNIADRRLIEIMNKYNLVGTFNLISDRFDHETVVLNSEITSLYSGHEIACHTLTHPHMERLPFSYQIKELLEDRKNLEEKTGYIVRGFAYPYGAKNEYTIPALKAVGLEYARNTNSTFSISQPEDLYEWRPSCHYRDYEKVYPRFINAFKQSWNFGGLFYIWGHSYEVADANEWEFFEDMCKRLSGLDDVWYATNIEIADYINAQKNLVFSANYKKIYNPSSTGVWISNNGHPVEIKPGEMVEIED